MPLLKVTMRLLCIFIFIFLFESGKAQQFGFFAGPQASTSLYKLDGYKQPTNFKYGFQFGIDWKVPFENKLYFFPEIFYSQKGFKVTFNQFAYPPDSSAKDNNTTIHCLELAPLLQYDLTNRPGHFFFRGGPSLDFQIYGRQKFHLANGALISQKMKYGFADYGHYAINLLAQLGYETSNGFSIYAQYSYGLTNISNVDFGPSIRNIVSGISISKYLDRKKIVIDTRNKE